MIKNFIRLVLVLLLSNPTKGIFAQDSCGRIATVNYQDIFIDSSSTKKGEGLRNFLAQTPESLTLLNEYQKNTSPNYVIAGASTVGFTLLLLGLTSNRESGGFYSKESLVSTGLVIMALSLVTSQTLKRQNEDRLMESIELYNSNGGPQIELPVEKSGPWFDFSFFNLDF